MGNENLERLKELTEKLASSTEYSATPREAGRWVIYKPVEGNVIGLGVYKAPDVAIQLSFGNKGSIFPYHSHKDEVEVLGVISGEIKITTQACDEIILKDRELIRLDQGMAHLLEFNQNTWLWSVTMPAAEFYPDGR